MQHADRHSEVERLVERLIVEGPTFHTADTDRTWTALPNTLRMIARHLNAGEVTLETGCGASTVVFAAAGTTHTAISPDSSEHERVLEYCERLEIDHSSLTFIDGYSDLVLPTLELPRALDAALIDADHSFPYPVIDWHYINRKLRVGGLLFADDLTVPAVGVVSKNMLSNPNWEAVEFADERAGTFRKVGHQLTFEHYRTDPFNKDFPDYSFLGSREALKHRAVFRLNGLKSKLAESFPPARRLYRRMKRRPPVD
jgi:hypothetical protein